MRFTLYIFALFPLEMLSQMCFFPDNRTDISFSVIDSGYIRVKYALNLSEENAQSDDIHTLELGKTFSKYYSYNVFIADSLRAAFRQKNPTAGGVPHFHKLGAASKYFWSEYYKDFTNNVLSEYSRTPTYIPKYYYTEDCPAFNWEIGSDTLSIAGYICQQAFCTFRGRNYTAWFTPEIPIDNGPWKFNGLPGLILKVYDNNRDYVFECISLENKKKAFPITKYNYKQYNKTNREKLLRVWKDIFDNYFTIIGGSGAFSSQCKSYNPLELE